MDVKGPDGYVAVEPSLHASGASYRWTKHPREMPEGPATCPAAWWSWLKSLEQADDGEGEEAFAAVAGRASSSTANVNLDRVEAVVCELLGPPKKQVGRRWLYPGPWRTDRLPSLDVCVAGPTPGLWCDRGRTGRNGKPDGGTLATLAAKINGWDKKRVGQFLEELGYFIPSPPSAPRTRTAARKTGTRTTAADPAEPAKHAGKPTVSDKPSCTIDEREPELVDKPSCTIDERKPELADEDNLAEGGEGEPWGDPEPLESTIYGEPMDPAALAVAPILHAIATECAVALQVPLETAAVLALAAVGGAASKRASLQLATGWIEPANLFALVLLESGARKSGLMSELVSNPLAAIERDNIRGTAARRAADADLAATLEKRKQSLIGKAARADDPGVFADELRRTNEQLSKVPSAAEPRLVAGDVTMEQLSTLLVESGGRIVIADPEASVLGVASGRYSSGNFSADALLKGHAGDMIAVDRRDRREVVHRPALTLCLALQPGIWQGLLAASPAARQSGLAARFLYATPSPTVGRRAIDPPPVREETRAAWALLLRQLDDLSDGAEIILRLDDNARCIFLDFCAGLEPRLAPDADLGELADWASKLPGAVGRVALALHMARHGGQGVRQPIDGATMKAALSIGLCLLSHARAAMGLGDATEALARRVVEQLRKSGGTAAREEIRRTTHARAEDLDDAVLHLVEKHVARARTETTGGRPRTTLVLNPALLPAAEASE